MSGPIMSGPPPERERSTSAAPAGTGPRPKNRRGHRRDEHQMVPDASFTSYYGRPIVKASPWEADIPAYLFLGGLAAGSSMLAAGADLTGRPGLRRVGRLAAIAAISGSLIALVHDLGRPSRLLNMLRVIKVTSPMSVGTWIVSAYAPLVYLAGADEVMTMQSNWSRRVPRRLRRLSGWTGRSAGLGAALIAPAVATYTGVLLADTATPSWNAARHDLPLLFGASAAAASAGMGLLCAPLAEAGPARRLALGAAIAELAVERRMEAAMGMTAEPLHQGRAGQLMTAARALTIVGGLGSLAARRSRIVASLSGVALLAGSACTRFGVFHAGQASARDPKYTVVPQRETMARTGRPGA